MSDPLATALARLAPHVDLGAGRDLFERARDGGEAPAPERRPRRMLVAASVLLVLAGALGVWAVAGREGSAPAVTPAGERGTGSEFRVVAREPVGEGDTRSLRAAGTPDDLDAFVQPYGADVVVEASTIDLASEVALVVVRNGNSCPDDLDRFEPVGEEWVAVWEPQGGDCEDVGIGWVYLVAVERSALPGIQWFVDPAQQQGPLSWDELRVAVPGTVVAPPTSAPGSLPPGTVDAIDVGGPAATGDEFAVIAREAVGDISQRRISVAASEEALRALLDGYRDGFGRRADEVDFARDIAVVIERFGNPCPPDIARFLPSDGAWRVQWAAPGEDVCETAGLGWVYVVAVERSALANVDTILLPADPAFDAPEIGAAVRDASIGPIVTRFAAGGIDGTMPAQDVTVFTEQAAWDRYAAEHFGGSPEAAIGLDRHVVVVFRFADDDDECARAIDRFDVAGDVWTPVFAAAAGTCGAGPITTTQAVAVERSALPDRVTFALAADDERGLPAASVTVDVARPEDSRAAYDVVSSGDWDGEPGLIGVATSRTTLQAIWTRFGIPDDLPAVGFDRDVVLVFTVDDESCRAVFDGFDRGPGTPYPTWLVRLDGPESTCDPMTTTLHVVTVRRAAIDGGVVFALPAAKRYGPEEVRVAADPAYSIVATTWSCGQFGITLDLPPEAGVRVEVVDGDTVTARGTLSGADAGTFGIEFGMDGQPSASWEAIVTDVATGSEVARTPLAHLSIPDCG